MKRILAAGSAALLVTMGPLGLLWQAPPAGALPARAGVTHASPSLGGWSLSASAAGMRLTYEQPNLPIPATPSAELDAGYTAATFGSGPVGQSTASVLYPGQVVASSGSQLGAIIPGAPALPDWPVQAHASYPTGRSSAKDDQGPMAMDASAAPGGSIAGASMGTPSGAAAVPAGLVTSQAVASTSHTAVASGVAIATALAWVHNLRIAGGVVEVASARSTATERSNGSKAWCAESSAVTGVTVAGDAVTVDRSGVHAAGHDAPIGLMGLVPQQVLEMAGISLKVTSPTQKADAGSGSCTAPSLEIRFDLTKFDADAGQLVASLPSQLAGIVYKLPLPVPDSQVVTLDLGSVSVQAAASPAYDPPPLPPPHQPGGGMPPPSPVPSGQPVPSAGSPSPAATPPLASQPAGVPSGLGPASGPAATAAAPSSAPPPAAAGLPRASIGSAVPTVFKGIGAPLVGLGVAAAAALALAVTRLDRRILAGARRMACAARPSSVPVRATPPASGAAVPPSAAMGHAGESWAVGGGGPGQAPPMRFANGTGPAKGARF